MAKRADVPGRLGLPEAWQKMLVATDTSIGPSPLFLFVAEHAEELSEVLSEALSRLTDPETWIKDGVAPRSPAFEGRAYDLLTRFDEALLEADRRKAAGG